MVEESKARVVHLTTVHPPNDIRIFRKEAKALARAGYDVTLIAPSGMESITEGVRVKGLPVPRTRFARMFGLTWRAFRVALRQRADVYHFHDPELLPMGVLLKLLTRAKVIYDVHEDVPKQVLNKHWIPLQLRGVVSKLAEVTEGGAVRVLDGIVPATSAIAARFPRDKTVLVRNFPILSEAEVPVSRPYKERPPEIAYVGGITELRGIVEMVQALDHVSGHDVSLVLAGRFVPSVLEERVRQLPGWRKVRYLGWQSHEQVSNLLGQVRIGLVLFHPAPNHMQAQPNKLFEYMAAGIPVIASDFPLWREIVEEARCGRLVDPQDPRAIADAIHWLLEHPDDAEAMGKRGQQAVLEKYNWDREAEKLISLYRRLL